MLRHQNSDEKDYCSNRFHHLIALGTKNSFIIKITEYLDENMLCLQAIKARDKEMAGVYCRYHIRLGMELYRSVLEKQKAEKSKMTD